MLIGFKFRNFRSFSTQQEFSFATSSDRTHASHLMATGMKDVPRLSKAAIVFGPNASGKTNLLMALAICRDLILHSTAYSEAEYQHRYTPFRLGASASQPTEFEFDVLLDHVRYRYQFAHDANRVTSERLLVYRTGKSQRWFDRRFDPATQREIWAPFSPNFNGPREMWRKATRPKALFLSTAAHLNSDQLAPLRHWVEHSLDIAFPANLLDINRIAAGIHDAGYKSRIIDLLHAVDIHVDDLRVTDHAPGGGPRTLEFLHGRDGRLPVWLDSAFEASGTQRLLGLFGPLLRAIETGKLLLIDEFDAGLHPLVARFLMRLINNPSISRHGAQLLLTSHNTTLMDLDILRRDEIWLVEVDRQSASNLLPLQHSSPRKHEMIAKNYLRGRYGAVPTIRADDAGPGESRPRQTPAVVSKIKTQA